MEHSGEKIGIAKLDKIVKKTIKVINESKSEIYDIAEGSRQECKRLEQELKLLKVQVTDLIQNVEIIEIQLKDSKRKLLLKNRNFDHYTQDELRDAYKIADDLRIELAVKREKEQYLLKRRNDLEIRLKESFRTVQKADKLVSNLGVALSYMTGDLQSISTHLEDLQQKQVFGVKIITAQEEERQRVAREIHDGPAQTLSNVVLKAEICERMIDVDLERTRVELKNLKSIVRDCLKDIRQIIYNLRPMSLDDLGLIPTLQRYVSSFIDETGINVSLKNRGIFDDISNAVSLTTFRLVQEALNNIGKHSEAENAVVNIEVINNQIRLYIYDDGKGFDTSIKKDFDEHSSGGFGLMSMKERIDLLNGSFEIESKLGKGTRLKISIPLFIEEETNNENN